MDGMSAATSCISARTCCCSNPDCRLNGCQLVRASAAPDNHPAGRLDALAVAVMSAESQARKRLRRWIDSAMQNAPRTIWNITSCVVGLHWTVGTKEHPLCDVLAADGFLGRPYREGDYTIWSVTDKGKAAASALASLNIQEAQ